MLTIITLLNALSATLVFASDALPTINNDPVHDAVEKILNHIDHQVVGPINKRQYGPVGPPGYPAFRAAFYNRAYPVVSACHSGAPPFMRPNFYPPRPVGMYKREEASADDVEHQNALILQKELAIIITNLTNNSYTAEPGLHRRNPFAKLRDPKVGRTTITVLANKLGLTVKNVGKKIGSAIKKIAPSTKKITPATKKILGPSWMSRITEFLLGSSCLLLLIVIVKSFY